MVTRGRGTLGGVKKESGASLVNCDKIVLGSISGKKSRLSSGILEHESQEATIMASRTLFYPLVYCTTFRRNQSETRIPVGIKE
jgi:hypothetical protein